MDLLMKIHQGDYPAGSFLPAPQKLAGEHRVGLNTVRRTITLLNKLGAAQSVNGVGTKVLPLMENAKYCDFSDPTIQKRLLDLLQTFHILCLSCRACAKATTASMDAPALRQWAGTLLQVKRSGLYENLIYLNYEMIAHHAPYQAVRSVYAELTRQFFWGVPLQDLHGDRQHTNAYFLPHLEAMVDCLSRGDGAGFSAELELLQFAEIGYMARYLSGLGIREAERIVLPDRGACFP